MAFNLNDIRASLVGGGARPSLFQVTLTNPIDSSGNAMQPFMIRATSLPEWEVGVIPVPYFGRTLPVPGMRKVNPWTVTVINDENFLVRNALENWNNQMDMQEQNIASLGPNPNTYKGFAIVRQYSKDGTPLRDYRMVGLFPSNISAIELDWSNADAIEEFQVTFQLDNFYVEGATGDAGGY